jgi:hypothetical protein
MTARRRKAGTNPLALARRKWQFLPRQAAPRKEQAPCNGKRLVV